MGDESESRGLEATQGVEAVTVAPLPFESLMRLARGNGTASDATDLVITEIVSRDVALEDVPQEARSFLLGSVISRVLSSGAAAWVCRQRFTDVAEALRLVGELKPGARAWLMNVTEGTNAELRQAYLALRVQRELDR